MSKEPFVDWYDWLILILTIMSALAFAMVV
jgi:hypothetical protein